MKDIVTNKKAFYNYTIEEKYEAGIALLGSEIKSIRKGKVSLKESFVSFVRGEAIIKGMNISIYKEATYNNHEETRERKLLLHKREIQKLSNKCKLQGYTVVPTKLYFKDGLVKIEIALAKGKSLFDKRQADKQKTMERAAKAALKR